MKYLKNIKPYEVTAMESMVNHTGNKIASRALIDNMNTQIRFFSMAKGESIDMEYYSMESLLLVIDGALKILYNECDDVTAIGGEIVALESEINYGIEALTDARLLSIMVKS